MSGTRLLALLLPACCLVAFFIGAFLSNAGGMHLYLGVALAATLMITVSIWFLYRGPGLIQGEYQDIFQNNPMPMWIFDLESLRILAVNDAAMAHYGYSHAEFLALSIRQLRPDDAQEALNRLLATPRESLNTAGIWRHMKKDGTPIDVEIVSHEFIWRSRPARLVAANDVTERLRAERGIAELNENLETLVEERTRQLESVNSELEAFSYSVSHDLRAPLRVIDGFGQALSEDYGPLLEGNGKKYLARIRATTQRMGVLIDDLLTLARVSRRQVRRETVDLSALARDILRELQDREPDRHRTVEVMDGMLAQADKGLVKIVLDNLIGNAWKFTAKTPEPHIRVACEDGVKGLTFRVSDDGAGFDMQYANKLFGAFQRLHAESDFAGTGIGLATVQRIVHLHGGDVWAEGRVGAGASFYFTLDPGATDE